MSLPCAQCAKPLPLDTWNQGESATCPGCRAPVTVLVFPAFSARAQSSPALPLSEGDASCFYHERKKAVAPCDRCGRFLCGLCQIDWAGENWCANCVESQRKGGQGTLTTRSVLYDSMALQLAVLPLLVWPLTIVTGPMSLYVAVRHWRSPGSLVRHTKVRLYLATAIAAIEIIGWIWLVAFAIARYL